METKKDDLSYFDIMGVTVVGILLIFSLIGIVGTIGYFSKGNAEVSTSTEDKEKELFKIKDSCENNGGEFYDEISPFCRKNNILFYRYHGLEDVKTFNKDGWITGYKVFIDMHGHSTTTKYW